jgi:hypothetical protein
MNVSSWVDSIRQLLIEFNSEVSMRLLVSLELPKESHGCGGQCSKCKPPVAEHRKKPTVEEQVRSMIDLVQSDRDSSTEWRALRSFYSDLHKMKRTARIENLIKLIKPVLATYGYHL